MTISKEERAWWRRIKATVEYIPAMRSSHITQFLDAIEAAEARAERAEKQLAEANLTSTLENSLDIINAVSEAVLGDKLIAALKIACPYCGHKSEKMEEATAHDGACEKHPAVIRAQKAERAALKLSEIVDDFCDACPDNPNLSCEKTKRHQLIAGEMTCSQCWLAWAEEQNND